MEILKLIFGINSINSNHYISLVQLIQVPACFNNIFALIYIPLDNLYYAQLLKVQEGFRQHKFQGLGSQGPVQIKLQIGFEWLAWVLLNEVLLEVAVYWTVVELGRHWNEWDCCSYTCSIV